MKAYVVYLWGNVEAICTSKEKAEKIGVKVCMDEYVHEDNFSVECIEMDKQIED